MILEPILPKILAVKFIPNAHPSLLTSYGADLSKHTSLGLITCDQDDPTYVALDEATKHAQVDVIFAKSFYAGASHASGALSGEILGVIAGSDPDEVKEGIRALVRTLEHDACFYKANAEGSVTVFPHVVSSIGQYFSSLTQRPVGGSMAYLIAPPLEATLALDAALKSADVKAIKVFTPPTETNFAGGWLAGDLTACETAAVTFAQTVVEIAQHPFG